MKLKPENIKLKLKLNWNKYVLDFYLNFLLSKLILISILLNQQFWFSYIL